MAAARALSPGSLGALALAAISLAPGCRGADSGAEQGASEAVKAGAEAAGPTHAPEVAAAIERGHALFFGEALCSTCHSVYDEGTMMVGPNLGVGGDMSEAFAARVGSRAEGVDPPRYAIESILDPNAVVVPGYARSVMKSPDDIPLALSDDDLVALAMFVISVGASEGIEASALAVAREHIAVAREQRRSAK